MFGMKSAMSGIGRALSPSMGGQQSQPGQPGNLFGPSASNSNSMFKNSASMYPGYDSSGGGGGNMMHDMRYRGNPTNPPMMGIQAPGANSGPIMDSSTGQPFVDPNQQNQGGGIGPSGGWQQMLQQIFGGGRMMGSGGRNPNVMY